MLFRSIIFVLVGLGIIVHFTAPFFYLYVGIFSSVLSVFMGILMLSVFINLINNNGKHFEWYFFIFLLSLVLYSQIYISGLDNTREENENLCRKMIGEHGTKTDLVNCIYEILVRKSIAIMIMLATCIVEML
ncbi:hypothetical protein RclHR1_20040002 [Rhizophagus clarus]|uniref:Uncharacterized protein n=1 Tax=Rhizophagus clarus TaxID=94130 RepID=A0A2Z6R359_9GLOM|nr:hypothetical protein RclHR1_20040002 [Rhizophagus clarus]GES87614.1 hypothetical protein GLOIN_2v887256 [Rhizophagus clarus]